MKTLCDRNQPEADRDSGLRQNLKPETCIHSSLSDSLPTLGNNLREASDGNRRRLESAIRTLGQRRRGRELERQRSTRSYLPGYRRIKRRAWALFARVKLIFPQKRIADEKLHVTDGVFRVIAN